MHFVDQGGGALGMGIGGVVIITLYSYKVRCGVVGLVELRVAGTRLGRHVDGTTGSVNLAYCNSLTE